MVCDGEDGGRETRDERFFGEQTADVKESEGRREGDDKRMWPERGCETLPILGSGSAPGRHQTNKLSLSLSSGKWSVPQNSMLHGVDTGSSAVFQKLRLPALPGSRPSAWSC